MKKAFAAMITFFLLGACTKPAAFSREQFQQISKRCGFTAVTYTPHYNFWSKFITNAPLIDFSQEKSPRQAHKCFDDNLFKVPAAYSSSGSGVWDTQE